MQNAVRSILRLINKTYYTSQREISRHISQLTSVISALLASVASPVTDHVNGENIYLDLCLALASMMRMLSKYVRWTFYIAHAHSDVACKSQKPLNPALFSPA